MELENKDIYIDIDFENNFTSKESVDGYSDFVNSKISNTIEKINVAIEQSTDNELKTQFVSVLKNAEEINNLTPSENEIIFISFEEEKSKYDKFETISEMIGDSEVIETGINEENIEETVNEIEELFLNNEIETDNLAKKVISSFSTETIVEETIDKNPFDGKNINLFGLFVTLVSCNGLRKKYLKRLRELNEEEGDTFSEKYAKAITDVSMEYFSSGVDCITTHLGGTFSTVSVGKKISLDCSAGYNDCYDKIVSFYKKKYNQQIDNKEEAKEIAEAIAGMYDKGVLNETIVGIYIQQSSPPVTMPMMESNSDIPTKQKCKIDTSAGKNLLYVSILAAYKIIEKISEAAQKAQNILSKVGIGKKFECSNDIMAMALSVGVKSMLALTKVETASVHSTAGGSGLLLPIGS